MVSAWYANTFLSFENFLDFGVRILLAVICGGLVGLERERRLKNAGIRTHIIVAAASALMMIVSKYAFMDIVGLEGLRLQADASRIAHGMISAIGFLGAGVIFVKRENVIGLTTAAGLWATVAIGLTFGAGMYALGVFFTMTIFIAQALLKHYHNKTHSQYAGKIRSNLCQHGITMSQFDQFLKDNEITLREISYDKTKSDETVVTASVVFKRGIRMLEMLEMLNNSGIFDTADIYPVM